jgi:phospholipid/cholesterol/gamma-HCH transport system substrate-binding protein
LALALLVSPLLGSCVFGGTKAISVSAIFTDVGDLTRYANVQTSDVKIGSVRGIALDGYHARVTMRLDAGAEVPANAEALIRSTSLLGEKFVDLRVPEGETASTELLKDGDVIPIARTTRLPGLDDALVKLGRLLEGGTAGDLASLIHSSATIVRGREEALGQIFERLRVFSGILAARAPDVSSAIASLDQAFKSLASGREAIARSLTSAADATGILVNQESGLQKLVLSLDRASAVLAKYGKATRPASDRALKDLRLVLDEAMKTTGDLDKAVSALAQFVDLWPRAIPGDYIQLDIVLTLANSGPSASSTARAAVEAREVTRLQKLADLLMKAAR